MEREIETVRKKPHWSYTAFNTYLTCPMRYYFRYIEHAEVERTSVSIPFGRAFHAVLSERAMKETNYTIEDAKEEFDFFFRGETEVCQNLTYKPEEDYWFWDKRGCDMLEVALADWPDDYTVKSVAEAFSVEGTRSLEASDRRVRSCRDGRGRRDDLRLENGLGEVASGESRP